MQKTIFDDKLNAVKQELVNRPWYISAAANSSFKIAHRTKPIEITYRRLGYYKDRIEVDSFGRWSTYDNLACAKAKETLDGILKSYE